MCKQILCPKCIGAKEIMQPKKEGKGFAYMSCTLCKSLGYVDPILGSDFELSLNEDNIESNNDW
jgi:hypothetical protein